MDLFAMPETRRADRMATFEELVMHMDQPGIDGDPSRDITRLKADITQEEALAVQIAVKRRRAVAGDRIIGHQASFTSVGMRAIHPDSPRPMVGTLLASLVRMDGDEVVLDSDSVSIEGELALLLGRDLQGPDLCAADVLAATEAFLPAIEVAPIRPGARDGRLSWPHRIAVQKAFGGYVVFGSKMTSARGVDTRLEGCLISIDGKARAGATGFAAMGSPLVVVAEMARKLHAIGEKLQAGQLVMTGSLAAPQTVTSANVLAHLEFQTLGGVTVRIAGGPRAPRAD